MRQVLAFHVGDRSRQSAAALWKKIPIVYQKRALFYPDRYEVYPKVIPSTQHRTITKLARKANHGERFHWTLGQSLARLNRATVSWEKKLNHHLGAITYFICDYKLTSSAA